MKSKLFENAEDGFEVTRKPTKATQAQERIEWLEQRLRQREEALAELMTEHVALKKSSIGRA